MGGGAMKFFKLKTVLFISLTALLSLSIAAVGLLTYNSFERAMVEHFAHLRVDVLSQVSGRLSEMERILRTTSNIYFQNNRLLWALSETPDQEWVNDELLRFGELHDVIGSTSGFPHATIFAMSNGYKFTSDSNIPVSSFDYYSSRLWFADVSENPGGVVFLSLANEDRTQFFIAAARAVVVNGEISGISLVLLDETIVSALYTPLTDDSYISAIDSRGRIISHSNPYMRGFNYYNMKVFNEIFDGNSFARIEKSGVPYLFSRYYNDTLGWWVVEEIPLGNILAPLAGIRAVVMSIGLAAIAIGAVFIFIIAATTTNPLTMLYTHLRQVGESGNTPVRFRVHGWREISTISAEFNQMVMRIENLLEDVQNRERAKRKAELDMLALQIHPHFIINTLFSVRCFMEMGKTQDAIKMQTSFISLMQYVLETDSDTITIEKELHMLEQYALLQKHRYGDKFTFTINCPQELYNFKILKLLLQPLFENALLHGIAPISRQGHIAVSLKKSDNRIEAEITDDGAGMDEETLAKVMSDTDSGRRIGVANVLKRLKLYFGGNHGLEIESALGCGTKVSFTFPIQD